MKRKAIRISNALLQYIPHNRVLFCLWVLILTVSVVATVARDDFRFLVVAPLALGLLLIIADFRWVYMLMWGCIPLSTEVDFEGGLSTDFPAEALMLVLTGVTFLWIAHRLKELSFKLLFHPVTILMFLHVIWICLSTISSLSPLLSLKFLVAKIWYVVPFYVLSYLLLRSEKEIKAWFFWVLIPLLLTVVVILVRHGALGFSFDSVNEILRPFYRNHVDYALMLGVFFPFVFVFRKTWMPKTWGLILCAILLVAIYLTYTRAAYLGLAVALGGFVLTRLRLVRYAIIAALIVVGVFIVSLSKDNRYIDYAPDYYKTVTHYKFDNLIEATYRFEDVSTMERFYRWIAAFFMVQERPLVGFGSNGFVPFYKSFTDEHFVTYVSNNPEQSGVHNYFLMTAVEQGIPGLIIFLALLFITLLRAEWLYHRLQAGFYRRLLTGVIGSLFFILFALLLNDMIETDKVGSFFFLNLALIAIIERNASDEMKDT